MVQAKAIGALASLNNKKYLSIFEKGLNSPSYSVQGNSAYAIAKIAPERAKALLDQIDLDNAGEELILMMMPTIVENKQEKHQAAIASTVAFYPFLKYQNPEQGAVAEKGFNWIMDTDNLKAVQNLTKVLHQVKSQIGDNVQAKMIIVGMLKDGLARKINLLKNSQKSESLNKQVELLNKAIEFYQ